jgi:hypothetical protein
MKKIFTFSTRIVILIAILCAGGCKSAKVDMGAYKSQVLNKVIIYLRSVEDNGEKYLYMYDSNGNSSIQSLQSPDKFITIVQPESEVFWVLELNSGIEEIKKIKSKHGNGNIFHADPSGGPSGEVFQLKLKKNAQGDEEYYIEVRYNDQTKKTFDPFLRIPPVDTIQ